MEILAMEWVGTIYQPWFSGTIWNMSALRWLNCHIPPTLGIHPCNGLHQPLESMNLPREP